MENMPFLSRFYPLIIYDYLGTTCRFDTARYANARYLKVHRRQGLKANKKPPLTLASKAVFLIV